MSDLFTPEALAARVSALEKQVGRVRDFQCEGCERVVSATAFPEGWSQTGHVRHETPGHAARSVLANWCSECRHKPGRIANVGGHQGCVRIVREDASHV